MVFGKTTIVNGLSAIHGFTSYLEICTPTTGNEFSKIGSDFLKSKHRLMYGVAADFDDGSPIDFRYDGFDIESKHAGLRDHYDIILVDPYHDYRSSIRDITFAYGLLRHGGIMVVHDCLPPSNGDTIAPTFVSGEWCGVTFIAYVDFLMSSGATFWTVDCDYGCGVIVKIDDASGTPPMSQDIINTWQTVRADPEPAFAYLQTEKQKLLHLLSPVQFLIAAGTDAVAAKRNELKAMADTAEATQIRLVTLEETLRTTVDDLTQNNAAKVEVMRQDAVHAMDRAMTAEQDVVQASNDATELARKLADIEQSLSWKITRPLRVLNRYVEHRQS